MSKHDISIHPLIQQYLHDLSQELACIPNNDREQHVSEIEGHLQSLVEEKIVQGKNTEQAIDEALKEFLPAKKLAKQIINEAEINNINSSSCCPSNRTEKKWPLYLLILLLSVGFAHIAFPFNIFHITIPTGLIVGALIITSISLIRYAVLLNKQLKSLLFIVYGLPTTIWFCYYIYYYVTTFPGTPNFPQVSNFLLLAIMYGLIVSILISLPILLINHVKKTESFN